MLLESIHVHADCQSAGRERRTCIIVDRESRFDNLLLLSRDRSKVLRAAAAGCMLSEERTTKIYTSKAPEGHPPRAPGAHENTHVRRHRFGATCLEAPEATKPYAVYSTRRCRRQADAVSATGAGSKVRKKVGGD